MGLVKKIFRSLFLKQYDKFAKTLGYEDWKSAEPNTFFIHHLEGDIGWYAAELPSRNWAVWKDEGQLPYPYKMFQKWEEAIHYLWKRFEESELPTSYWMPEGFDENENIFLKKPDRNKKL